MWSQRKNPRFCVCQASTLSTRQCPQSWALGRFCPISSNSQCSQILRCKQFTLLNSRRGSKGSGVTEQKGRGHFTNRQPWNNSCSCHCSPAADNLRIFYPRLPIQPPLSSQSELTAICYQLINDFCLPSQGPRSHSQFISFSSTSLENLQ